MLGQRGRGIHQQCESGEVSIPLTSAASVSLPIPECLSSAGLPEERQGTDLP